MEIDLRLKKLFKSGISITAKDCCLSILNRKDKDIAGMIMSLALRKGCSVIVYGSDVDYYRYILDEEPQYIYTLDNKILKTDYRIPFISGSKQDQIEHIRNCFADYELLRVYENLARKQNGNQLQDPNLYKSYWQIKQGNTSKEKIVTEALLVNLLTTSMYGETLHEVVLFMPAPFRPISKTMLDTLSEVSKGSFINVVLMYEGLENEGEEYALYSEDEKIFFKGRNNTFEVTDGEIFKKI